MKKLDGELLIILVVCISLGMTLGNEYGDMAIGAAIGAGVGTILMFVVDYYKKRKNKK